MWDVFTDSENAPLMLIYLKQMLPPPALRWGKPQPLSSKRALFPLLPAKAKVAAH